MNYVIKAILFLCVVTPTCLSAQPLQDTSFVGVSAQFAKTYYNNLVFSESGLYVGSQYRRPIYADQEHPYFRLDDFVSGNVIYQGGAFVGVPLLYDLMVDQLITEHIFNGNEIILVKNKVSKFSLGDALFVNIPPYSLSKGLPEAGYYQVFYDGSSKFLGRYHKKFEQKIEDNQVKRLYKYRERFYIMHGEEYVKVSSVNDVLKVFKAERSKLKAAIRDKNLSISKKSPLSMAAVANLYDNLKESK